MSAVRASLVVGPGALRSREKNEFGIGGDAISRCLEGLEFATFCTVDSPKNSSSPPQHHPRYFYANLDKLRDPYFQKVGRCVPPDPRGSARAHIHAC